ncbi:MAG TPA: hypothetical protein DCM38_11970, partial [Gammaproteobacteria bacterium]|nr:hypothetical protein [Gammaproteobacteria bacterium]
MPVLTEGFILPSSELEMSGAEIHTSSLAIHHFRFLHDRVQQAAYALIDDAQKKAVHLQIGRLSLKNTSAADLDKTLFEIVEHFNLGRDLINNPLEKVELARLNLKAGQKAKVATAYSVAAQYLRIGQAYLREKSLQTEEYELILNLYIETLEVEYLNTNYEQADKLAEIVLQQAKTTLDKVKVYEIKIQAYAAQNKMQLALNTGLHVLKMLNVSLLERPPADLSVEKLSHLPPMVDPLKLAIQRIILAIYVPAFIIEPPLGPKLAFTMLNLCLQGGNSPAAVFIYSCYGVIRISELEIEEGYQFGQLALQVYEQYEAKKFKCKLDNCFNSHIRCWKEPVRDTLRPLRETIQVGLEIGDLEFCGHATAHYCSNLFLSGESLPSVKQAIQQYLDLQQRLKQSFNLYFIKIWGQLAHNLSEKTADKLKLDGELFDETQFFQHPDLKNNQNLLFVLYLGKTILTYLFKEYDTALFYATPLEDYAKTAAGLLTSSYPYFYHSLVLLAKYPAVSKPEQIEFLTKVATHQQKLKILASHAPMNFQHKYDLVEAEKARILRQYWEAAELYEKAIAGAKENEYLHEEALTYELAAEFYLGRGMEKIAQTYFREAHYRYQQWGALTKVNDLETRYPQFIVPKTAKTIPTNVTISATRMPSTSTTTGSEWLDLNSIMKAAQTLSGEIVLSRLLEKMMHIVIENAGASFGFLLLPQNDNWFVEATGCMNSDDVKVLQTLSLESQPIAETIIHYVARTKENVVLNNACVEGQFTRDAHIISQRPQSVLCAPLVNQGKLTGILYLENNLTTGAFTPDRLQVLQVLSSQLAVSIENALLYRTLEQKVEARTAQLAEANQEITVLNEQLQSDNLRMSAELDVSRRLQKMLLPSDKELE